MLKSKNKKVENKKESRGCGIAFVAVVLLILWGFGGMAYGHGFMQGIEDNLQALWYIIIIGLVILGIYKLTKSK